ncbi:prolipoprotein diacylglyceryl transferase [Sulfurimonas marina]|uniref:Phosphatidylglycerol--prolipoprotein diacylglyceryl transferase n=1 Tax=Sulfurimonas marina TaxID=2590551 RepID=A0A7M1ATU3_9BACT|nr:prolipoprotein diacylglyceryl transferase [Sulfurimonas marina]QOP40837.1 prolipoprotein diacylglyceryl transferase [Sulfurimonas marina]
MEHLIWSVDPVALSLGGMQVYWYGILFAAAILVGLEIMKWIYKKENKELQELDSMFLYVVIGIVIGARLGHCLFYEPDYYLAHPIEILYVWKGGLASHGGGLGALLGIYLYKRKHSLNLLWFLDKIAIPTAFFAFFVRMGNLMNSEILGKVSDVSWAIVFSRVDKLPRHPAQLYEALSYLLIGLVLFSIYIKFRDKLKDGFLFGLFLTLVFIVRFLVEFVKERQADYAADMLLSTGQLLSIPFIVLGVYLMLRSCKK